VITSKGELSKVLQGRRQELAAKVGVEVTVSEL
jgi:hypothetical protein